MADREFNEIYSHFGSTKPPKIWPKNKDFIKFFDFFNGKSLAKPHKIRYFDKGHLIGALFEHEENIYFTNSGVNSKKFFTIFYITMTNVEIFDTTFAMTILVIMAICIPTILLLANWFLHPGKIKQVLIKGSSYECGLAHVSSYRGSF